MNFYHWLKSLAIILLRLYFLNGSETFSSSDRNLLLIIIIIFARKCFLQKLYISGLLFQWRIVRVVSLFYPLIPFRYAVGPFAIALGGTRRVIRLLFVLPLSLFLQQIPYRLLDLIASLSSLSTSHQFFKDGARGNK